ncbi:FAS1 [Glarea lozoyensis ATCC 20868]|uniref:FAS1 n=1 Tax=Glarea lozoyensis (strain ATCC 20868 / MF5171) TaxID=1116229 RepID=S3CD42_GLAL2|nr:FAS1 [Glarea lozoyensis ATCC 20868]EPE24462.1 FAS1 [Glarea lozoyensis ATCC 20868]
MPDQNLGPALPSSPSKTPSNPPPSSNNNIYLSDVLGTSRSINIFAGFTRDFAPISQRFEDENLNTTILAPLNSAIMALPRKPWEDPADGGEGVYDAAGGEEKAQRNLMRFVEAHVVGVSPWEKGQRTKTLEGGEVWWEEKGGKKVIQPGDIEVDSVANQVHNGEVWILKGVRNYK